MGFALLLGPQFIMSINADYENPVADEVISVENAFDALALSLGKFMDVLLVGFFVVGVAYMLWGIVSLYKKLDGSGLRSKSVAKGHNTGDSQNEKTRNDGEFQKKSSIKKEAELRDVDKGKGVFGKALKDFIKDK